MAVTERFELSIGFKANTPLAGERLQPLGHVTGHSIYKIHKNVSFVDGAYNTAI